MWMARLSSHNHSKPLSSLESGCVMWPELGRLVLAELARNCLAAYEERALLMVPEVAVSSPNDARSVEEWHRRLNPMPQLALGRGQVALSPQTVRLERSGSQQLNGRCPWCLAFAEHARTCGCLSCARSVV